jgi:hypothetical protein
MESGELPEACKVSSASFFLSVAKKDDNADMRHRAMCFGVSVEERRARHT